MGVPALFRWLSQKYPKIISQVIEEKLVQVDGHDRPVDTTGPNPNGEEFDNLYLDMNGIVHPCSHPEDRPPPATEEEMMLAVFKYTDRVVNMVRPRKLLMIAVDGVAPRAKMNQQRSRRFRSAQEAKEKDEDKAELMKMLKSQNGGVFDENAMATAQKKTWDSNAITPGTPFMDTLAASLRYWCAYKLNQDPGWAQLKVIISDATVPGEGEHKIMQFVRSQRSSPQHDPNTRHVIYGLDADLIMLGLATHEPHFRVLREDVFFQESKARTCKLCGQKGHIAEACKGLAAPKEGEFDEKDKALSEKPFIWLHVSILREYLQVELMVPGVHGVQIKFDLERAIDDWVFMCFFVGNDFLPHLPSLDIRENGIDILIAIWRDNLSAMGSYVTKDGQVDLERAQFILDGLAKQEDAIFRNRKQVEDRREANNKRRKLEDERRQSYRSANGAEATPLQIRRGSPDYSNGNASARSTKSKTSAPTVAPPDLPLFTPGARDPSREERAKTYDMVVNRGAQYKADQANKSAAAVLKNQLLRNNGSSDSSVAATSNTDANGGDSHALQTDTHPSISPASTAPKRKADAIEGEAGEPSLQTPESKGSAKQPASDEPPPDSIRLWDEGYADRYYEQKFKVDAKDIAFRNQVARDYLEGLCWVLLYYMQGCPSWTWYYPHHYAPFAADFVDLKDSKISFEKGTPFRPFEQLMGVLPAASNHAIPSVFRPLMEEPDSEIIDFYPSEFPIDLNGKKFAWQGVALLPFIDEKRLLDAMATKYPLLEPEDAARNEFGKDVLLLSDKHRLYDDISNHFYTKRQDGTQYQVDPMISDGLAGILEKNDDFIPQSSLVFPLDGVEDGMPSLEGDRSMSVHYDMPHSIHVHKSMLLRGLDMPETVLERADIEATEAKARNSGRSFGGAPLRGGRHQGRGGRVNYGSDRGNPFAPYVHGNAGSQHGPGGGPPPPNPYHQGYMERTSAESNNHYGSGNQHGYQYPNQAPDRGYGGHYGAPPPPPGSAYGYQHQAPGGPPPYYNGPGGQYGQYQGAQYNQYNRR